MSIIRNRSGASATLAESVASLRI